MEEVSLMSELLDQELALITSGIGCVSLNSVIMEIRIMDFSKLVAVYLSQGVIVF